MVDGAAHVARVAARRATASRTRGRPLTWSSTSTTRRRVDALVDAIEQGGVAAASTSEQAGLEGDQLVYELDEWNAVDRQRLGEELTAAGVPFVWDSSDALVVSAEDEEAVEHVLDMVEYPDALDAVDGEGDGDDEAAQEMLSELFLSSDRLMHDPTDEDGTNGLLKAVEVASEVGVPYGLAPATWKAVLEHASELREGLSGGRRRAGRRAGDCAAVIASSVRVSGTS